MQSLAHNLTHRAREILSDPSSWTQWVAARDAGGRPVSPCCNEAKKFCGFGALTRAAHEKGLSEWLLLDIFAPGALATLIRVNDDQSHAAVLGCLHRLGE
jgi:hypothetical protein